MKHGGGCGGWWGAEVALMTVSADLWFILAVVMLNQQWSVGHAVNKELLISHFWLDHTMWGKLSRDGKGHFCLVSERVGEYVGVDSSAVPTTTLCHSVRNFFFLSCSCHLLVSSQAHRLTPDFPEALFELLCTLQEGRRLNDQRCSFSLEEGMGRRRCHSEPNTRKPVNRGGDDSWGWCDETAAAVSALSTARCWLILTRKKKQTLHF